MEPYKYSTPRVYSKLEPWDDLENYEDSIIMESPLLDLSGNRLTSVPPEIGKLILLRRLDLSGNRLTSVPADITKLTGLVILDVSDNRWPSIPSQIYELNKIIESRKIIDIDDLPF